MRKYRPFVDAAVNGSIWIPMRRSDIGSRLSSFAARHRNARPPGCIVIRVAISAAAFAAIASILPRRPSRGRLRGRPTASTKRGCLGPTRMRRPHRELQRRHSQAGGGGLRARATCVPGSLAVPSRLTSLT